MANTDRQHSGDVVEADITDLLSDPRTYPNPCSQVEVIETHAARIFLAGDHAYKVKKHVAFPFLDFTTLEARKRAICREMELNTPFAPEIYLGVVAIARERGGGLVLGGEGPAVEWVLHMRRFSEDSVLTNVAERGPLGTALSNSLANMAATYHRQCEVAPGDGQVRMRTLVKNLADEIESAAGSDAGRDLGRSFCRAAEDNLARTAVVLDHRARAGAVRRCHGDLHLGNIVLQEGRPVPFDALEFDESLATIDVLYDLAFLLMDLNQRGDRAAANVVLNAYTGHAPVGGEYEGLVCLPLFLACRAAIRAVVAMERARQPGADAVIKSSAGLELLRAANRYLVSQPARLIAVGGLSGTGKSTLSAALAPFAGMAPGAIHLRSDVERKRLLGVEEQRRLGEEAYAPAVTKEVYRIIAGKASAVLASGHSAIVDAVFAAPAERKALEAVAARAASTFSGLWLEAPSETLVARVEQRRGDASDADARVVAAQLTYDTGEIDWQRIDAGAGPGTVLDLAFQVLGLDKLINEQRWR